jgi:subtilisin family serine protease
MRNAKNNTPVGGNARFQVEALEQRTLMSISAADLQAAGFEAIQWNGQTTYVVPDEWIVQVDGLKGTANKQLDAADGLLVAAGVGAGFKASRHLGSDGLILVTSNKHGETFANVKAALGKVKGLKSVEPNFAVWNDAITPNDPSFNQLWGLNNTGQTGGTADADIDAPEAWSTATGAGSTVVIGIIDTGVNYNHPDLAANAWVNPGEVAGDGIDNDANGFIDDVHGWDFVNNDSNPMDDNGHGTHVSGTIAGVGNNGVGVTGVSWGAKVMGLKFLNSGGSGSTAGAIAALNYATMMKTTKGINLKATNNSWGGGGFSSTLQTAIQNNANAGMLFIAAAGNSGVNSDLLPQYPAAYPVDNIISVAATDHKDALASFSNFGAASVDLGAPGVSVYSSYLGSYASLSGTSMATPHVTGAVALAWAYAPTKTRQEIRAAILAGVDAIVSLAGKTVTGGRLNLAKVLANVAPSTPVSPPAAPTLNTASAASSSQINLTWSNVTGETEYHIYRSSGGSSFTIVGTVAADVTSYSNTGLAASTAYTYLVRAFNSGGESVDSNQLSATTLAATGVPSAPSALGLTVLSRSQIRLNWTDGSGNETGFKIERSTDGTSWTQIATVGANVTTFTSSGLKRRRTYWFRVRAYNAVGNSGYTNSASATTLSSLGASTFSSAPIGGNAEPLTLEELEALMA